MTNLISFIDNKYYLTNYIELSPNIKFDKKDGYLFCYNVIAGRTGAQRYHYSELKNQDIITDNDIGADGYILVYRNKEDIINDELKESSIGKVVSEGHPNYEINSLNYKNEIVGTILNTKFDEKSEYILMDIVIYDNSIIEKIMDETNPLRQLSLGYSAELYRDRFGRIAQRKVIINHLALVKEGRAGIATIRDECYNKEKEESEEQILSLEKKKIIKDEDNEKKEDVVKDELEVETKEEIKDQDKDKENDKPKEKEKEEVKDEDSKEKKESVKDNIKERTEKVVDRDYILDQLDKLSKLNDSEFKDSAMKKLDEESQANGFGSIIPKQTKKTEFADSAEQVDKENIFRPLNNLENNKTQTFGDGVNDAFDALITNVENIERQFDPFRNDFQDKKFYERQRYIQKKCNVRIDDLLRKGANK